MPKKGPRVAKRKEELGGYVQRTVIRTRDRHRRRHGKSHRQEEAEAFKRLAHPEDAPKTQREKRKKARNEHQALARKVKLPSSTPRGVVKDRAKEEHGYDMSITEARRQAVVAEFLDSLGGRR